MQNEQTKAACSSVELALAEAKQRGASAAEAGVGLSSALSVTVRLDEVETIEYHRDQGLSVTVYYGQRKGSASTTDLSDKAVRETVQAASDIARYTAEDTYAGLADKELMAWDFPDLDLDHPWDIDADRAVDLALECERAAREFDKRVTNSEGATVATQRNFRVYGNSHGFIGAYPSTSHSLNCSVIAQMDEAMQRNYWYTRARIAEELDSARSVGIMAAERTVQRLQARRLTTRKAPVIFAAEVAGGLIGHFLGAVRGGAQYRKTTFLLDCIGQQVFPEFVHIEEQPRLVRGLHSAPFDSDGVATFAHDLIRDGVVQSYVLDAYAARRLKLQTTGNAGGLRNLRVSCGDQDLNALLKQMGTGLLVTELMGQGVNRTTGDYSRGASGFWIEGGEIQFPVEEITIAGNLKQMYRELVAIGNDIDYRGNVQIGSVLLGEMTIAGE